MDSHYNILSHIEVSLSSLFRNIKNLTEVLEESIIYLIGNVVRHKNCSIDDEQVWISVAVLPQDSEYYYTLIML
jgi:hypothetical protein